MIENHEFKIEYWTRLIQERVRSGLTIAEFCQQKELSQNAYYYWLRTIRKTHFQEEVALLPKSEDRHELVDISASLPLASATDKNDPELTSRVPSMVIRAASVNVEIYPDTPQNQIRLLMEVMRNVSPRY